MRGEYWNSADIKLRKLDADKILKQVKEEVFKYAIKGKRAVLSLFDEVEDDTEFEDAETPKEEEKQEEAA